MPAAARAGRAKAVAATKAAKKKATSLRSIVILRRCRCCALPPGVVVVVIFSARRAFEVEKRRTQTQRVGEAAAPTEKSEGAKRE